MDDDEVLRHRLCRAFEARGFEVKVAENSEEALTIARVWSPELAVVDLRMPGRSGLELVGLLVELDPSTKIVVLTGYSSIATAVEAVRLGATNYLQKPADVDDILAAFLPGTEPLHKRTSQDLRPPSLARAEWEHINRVLADCGGNISEAARCLGLHRRSLQRKLQKHPPNQ